MNTIKMRKFANQDVFGCNVYSKKTDLLRYNYTDRHTHTHQVPCIDTAPCYHTDRPPWNCYSCYGRYHQHYTDRADSSGDCRSQVSTGHTYHLCSPPYRCTVQ